MNLSLNFNKFKSWRPLRLKPGMTMIEIIVVISIMAILAAVAIPATLSFLKKGKVSATTTTLENTKTVIMSYYGDTNQYPKSLEDLITRPADIAAFKWHGPYFDKAKLPKDGWGNELEYQPVKTDGHPFALFSWGPEGVDSTEGSISVWDLD